MHSAALIAYPLTVMIYPDRIHFDQNGTAFSTDANDSNESIPAEHVFAAVAGCFHDETLCPIADITRFHRYLPVKY
jgi:hypothetical protein